MNFLVVSLSVAGLLLCGCSRKSSEMPEPPQKVVFPIGGYSGDPARDREAGFTVAGPVYGKQQETFLAQCEAAGLPCIYPVGVAIDFLGKTGPEPTELDFDSIRNTIREQVNAVVDHPLVVCWYLTPEELRFWKPLEMKYLKVASEAIREADPKKRPVWMYEPGHRTQPAMEKTVPHLGIAGKGIYPNYSSRQTERAWVPWTVGQQAGAIRAVNPSTVPYAILEMLKKPDESYTDEAIRRWVRHDAYASLVGGVQGIVIFSFGNRAGFSRQTREWQTYYDAWSGVAAELNGPNALGSVFLKGTPVAPPPFRQVKGEKRVTLSKLKEPVEVAAVSSAAFRWGSAEYWIVVNSSEQPVQLTLDAPLQGWTPLLSGQPTAEGTMLRLAGTDAAVFRRDLP